MERLRVTSQNAALIMMALVVLAYSPLGGGVNVLLGINRLLLNGASTYLGFALTPAVLLVGLVWVQPQVATAPRERTWIVFALLLLGLSLSSTILNLDRSSGEADDDVMVLVCLFWYALPVLFFVGLLRLADGAALTRRLVELAVAMGTVVFLHGIAAFIASFGLPDAKTILFARYDVERFAAYMAATYGHPNGGTGCMLALLLPCAVGIARDRRANSVARWFARLFCIVGPINVVIGGSRTAIVIVLGWLVFWLVSVGSWARRLCYAAVVIGCVVTAAVAMGPAVQIAFGDIVSSSTWENVRHADETSAAARQRAMGEFLHEAMQRPALGWGPYYHNRWTAHQMFIHQATEIGVPGSLVFVSLFLALLWGVLRHGPSQHRVGDRVNRGWFARHGAFLYMLFGTVANVPLGGAPPANTMVMMLALLLASMLIEERAREAERA